jgi:septal ring factor EnvC (AmiA/AmiB activator)
VLNKQRSWILAAALGTSLGAAAAYAQNAPAPDAPAAATPGDAASPQDLNALQQQIKQGKAQQEQLQAKAAQLDKEIADLQAQAVKAAGQVQDTEAQVTELEDTLQALSDEEQDKTARLAAEREKLTQAVLALQRLSSQPPEALLFSAEPPIDAARTARLLALITPALDARARALQSDLNELQEMRQQMAQQRDALATAVAKLAGENARLSGLIGKKAALQKSTLAESASAQAKLDKLGGQAKNLQDLIERLNKAKAETGPAQSSEPNQQLASAEVGGGASSGKPASPTAPQRMQQPPGFRNFPDSQKIDAKNTVFAPARGRILTHFGDPTDTGGVSKGWVLETRPGAQIVAPFDGRIAFEGPFRSYGQILIIEHGGGYHTVLAGLDRVDAAVGQWLLAGEPLGVMAGPGSPGLGLQGSAANNDGTNAANASGMKSSPTSEAAAQNDRPKLYLELRRNGQPIDPGPWFASAEAKAVNSKGQ